MTRPAVADYSVFHLMTALALLVASVDVSEAGERHVVRRGGGGGRSGLSEPTVQPAVPRAIEWPAGRPPPPATPIRAALLNARNPSSSATPPGVALCPGYVDPGIAECQRAKFRQASEVVQSGVRDLRAVENQFAEPDEGLEMGQAGVGDLGVAIEIQFFELPKPFEALQPGVGDLRVAENQYPELLEPPQAFEPGIGHREPEEVQPLEAGRSLERVQRGVGDRRPVEVEVFQQRQIFEVRQPLVRDLRAAKTEFPEFGQFADLCQVNIGDRSPTDGQCLEMPRRP